MQKSIKLILITFFSIIILFSIITPSFGYYQAVSSTSYSDIAPYNAILYVRRMEMSGQVMGLNENADASTLKSTSESNNIDVHMMKNTEYGAILLLSASQDYGKKGTGTARYILNDGLARTAVNANKHTTTGNVYGICYWDVYNKSELRMNTASFTGTGYTSSATYSRYKTVDDRYINRYMTYNTKAGDAELNWHENKTTDYFYNSGNSPYNIVRNYSTYRYGPYYTTTGTSDFSTAAVAVCGQGL